MATRKKKKEGRPFSKILSSLMKERGITLKEAASIAGVSQSTISDWRSGTSPEDYMAVQELANYLGVSLSFILTGKEDSVGGKPASVIEVFEEDNVVFDGYAKITIQKLIPRKKEK